AVLGVVAAALVLSYVAFAWKLLPVSRVRVPALPAGHRLPREAFGSWRQGVHDVARPLWNVIRHPARPVSEVIWVYGIGMPALNALIAVLSLYLQRRFGLNEDTVGPVYFVFSAVGVVMRTWPVGWINERLGEVRTMRLGAVLLGIGLLLMPLPT